MMTRMIGRDGGGRICLALVMAGTLAQISFAAAYSYDDPEASERTLYVELDSGTEYFVADWITPAGATVTNLVKRGDGLLYVTNDFSALVFDTRVEDGILRFGHKNALGSSTAGVVTVCDGATLRSDGTPGRSLGSEKHVYFEGRGHEGMGALYKTNYDWGHPFGALEMTGDAYIYMASAEDHVGGNLNMNGHELVLETGVLGYHSTSTVTNYGTMVWTSSRADGKVNFSDWLRIYASASSKLAFTNILWNVNNFYPINGNLLFKFGLEFREGARMNIAATRPTSTYNQWWGPVSVLRDVLPVTVSANKDIVGFGISGAVSGGGFNLTGQDTTTLEFRLSNADNTFTNGISGTYASLCLGRNGALPAAGGPLVLTNSTCELEDLMPYALPDASFDGTCTVSGGPGRWRSLAKTGSGTLAYESTLGADTLDISGGVVDLSAITNRAAYAGLVEGRKTDVVDYSKYTSNLNNGNYLLWAHINNKGYLVTNTVTRGTRLMYDNTRNEETGWTTNCIFTYSGYIWNNSPTNEVWAFASAVYCYWRIDIDNQFAMGYYDWWGSGYSDGTAYWDVMTNTVVLAPGPHRFEYRGAVSWGQVSNYGIKSAGYLNSSHTFTSPEEVWADNCGLMYNDSGVCSRLASDYKKLIDPGDGSLFTWDIPSEGTVPHPVTGEPIKARPVFGKLKAASGTTLRVPDGTDWTFAESEGGRSVTGGGVTVTNSWTFDGTEVGTAAFAISGPLTFGENAKVVLSDEAKPPSQYKGTEVTLGTAAGGISGVPAKDPSVRRWFVRVDGNSLKATYSEGMALIIR